MTEITGAAPPQPSLKNTQPRNRSAVIVNGKRFDVCVRERGSNKILLLVENFEDVSAPEQLTEAAERKAGCTGYLETAHGVLWHSDFPLIGGGGNFVFTPHPPGVVDIVKSCVARWARALKTPTSTAKSSGIKMGVYQPLLQDTSQ